MDKEAFFSNNADPGEKTMVFDTIPSYEEVVAKVRHVLEWMDPNDDVKLIGRYDVGVGVKSRLKSMPITSDLHWDVYKDKVEGSQDKSLELFATKVEILQLELDLNRNASSPIHDGSGEVYVHNSSSQPPSSQPNEEDINDRAIVVRDEATAHVDEDDIAQDDAYAEEGEIH